MKKLMMAVLAMVCGSVFADTVTMTTRDVWNVYKSDNMTPICSWVDGEHWSDGLSPHDDADYVIKESTMNVRNNVQGGTKFAGKSLTLGSNGVIYLWWNSYPNGNYHEYPIDFGDITMGDANAMFQAENGATTANGLMKYLLRGNFTLTGGKSAWPAQFQLPKVSGGWFINEMNMIGANNTYLDVNTQQKVNGQSALPDENDSTKISETGLVGADFNGDNSEFLGEILANNNVAIRVGNSMPGKVTLLDRWSAVGSSAETVEVEVGTVEFNNGGILLASDKYKPLKVNNVIRNGEGKTKVRLYDFSNGGIASSARIEVLKVPATIALTKDDFVFNCDNPDLLLEVTEDGGYKTLSIVNPNSVEPFDSTGYVTLTADDPEDRSQAQSKFSYFFAGNWSDNLKPTPEKKYYVGYDRQMYFINYDTIAIARDQEEGLSNLAYWSHFQFRGGSLVIGGTAFFLPHYKHEDGSESGYAFDIADLKLLSTSRFTTTKKDGSGIGEACIIFGYNANRCNTVITILADKRYPTVWEGGKKYFGYVLGDASRLVGDRNSGIRLTSAPTCALGDVNAQSFVELKGDMSEFLGTIMVEGNQTLKISKSMPGTVEMVDTTYGFLSFENVQGEISLGKLVTKGAMEFEIPAAMTGLIIGGVELGGDLNIIDPNFVNGKIKLGKVTGDYTVTVNGEPVGMLSNGILYTGEKEAFMASLKIAGEGTVYEPYILDTVEKAKCLLGVEEQYIIVFDAPLNGENNNNRKTDYIDNWRVFFVDNYNSANDAKFPSDNSGEAYTSIGYTIRDSNRWEWFWSDKQAPHAGSEYVLYPEVWGVSHYTKAIKITGDMQAPFAGDSLTVGLNWWLYFTQNISRGDIKKLVMLPDSGIKQYAEIKDENKLLGATYIRGYENHPVRFYAEAGAKSFAFEGTLVADSTGVLQLEAVTSLTASFTGDMTGYCGKIVASTNATVRLVDSGLVNGMVELAHKDAKLLSNGSGRIVMLKKLIANVNATIEVPAGEIMRIDAIELGDGVKITKKGAGVLLLPEGVSGVEDESGATIAGTSMEEIPENGNGLSYRDSYALGLMPMDVNSKPFVNKRKASAAGKLALGLDNVKVNKASGVKFTLKASADNARFEAVGSEQTEPEFEIDLPNEKLKYYKIEYSFE